MKIVFFSFKSTIVIRSQRTTTIPLEFFPVFASTENVIIFKRLDLSMLQSSNRSSLTAICLLCAFLCIIFRCRCCYYCFVVGIVRNNTIPTIFHFSLERIMSIYFSIETWDDGSCFYCCCSWGSCWVGFVSRHTLFNAGRQAGEAVCSPYSVLLSSALCMDAGWHKLLESHFHSSKCNDWSSRAPTVCYENDLVWRILHVSTHSKYTHCICGVKHGWGEEKFVRSCRYFQFTSNVT